MPNVRNSRISLDAGEPMKAVELQTAAAVLSRCTQCPTI